MTSPISSEDETFDRLRRIDITALEKEFEWLTHCVAQNELFMVWCNEAQRVQDRRVKIIKTLTFGLYSPKYNPPIIHSDWVLYKNLCDEAWPVTGWTYEAYSTIQYNIAEVQLLEKRRLYARDQWLWLSAFLTGSVISAIFLALHPAGWITGTLVTISVIGASYGVFGQIVSQLRAWDKKP